MIRRVPILAALASMAALCGQPASATIQPIATSGLWTAFGGTGDDNRAVCGIGTEGLDTRRITIQQFAGDTSLQLLLKKDTWAIPPNTQVGIRVQFDAWPPAALQATGAEHTLTVTLPFDQSVPFMRGIRAARQIRILFDSGNETPWTGGLNGSSRATDAFNRCRDDLTPASPSQPFNPQSPAAPAAPTPPAPTHQ
jgi:hypothetical protein